MAPAVVRFQTADSSNAAAPCCCRWLQEGRVICEDQVKTPFKQVKKRGAEAPAQDQEVIIWDPMLLLTSGPCSDCLSNRGQQQVCSNRQPAVSQKHCLVSSQEALPNIGLSHNTAAKERSYTICENQHDDLHGGSPRCWTFKGTASRPASHPMQGRLPRVTAPQQVLVTRHTHLCRLLVLQETLLL